MTKHWEESIEEVLVQGAKEIPTVIYHDHITDKDHLVNIVQGYRHPSNGFFVEIWSDKISRKSVSIWSLRCEDSDRREFLIQSLFGISVNHAIRIDMKKGVFKDPNMHKLLETFWNHVPNVN